VVCVTRTSFGHGFLTRTWPEVPNPDLAKSGLRTCARVLNPDLEV